MRFWGLLFRLVVLFALLFWLAAAPGSAHIVWHHYDIRTSAAFLAVVVFGTGCGLYLLFRVSKALLDGPRFWRLHQKISKIERGNDLIAQGLVALAGGNAAEAGRLALAARKALGETTSTWLLQAQAASLAGDRAVAAGIYKHLAERSESAILGYRGLIVEALREGKWEEVERLAALLKCEKPDLPWLHLIAFELAVRRRRWIDASASLAKAAAARLIDPATAARREAALLLAEAEAEARAHLEDRALQTAEKALRKAPGWMPALIALAERQIAGKHFRAALRLIEKNWKVAPHPELARLYEAAVRAQKPVEAFRQIEKLARLNPDHPESLMALARAALAADLWGEARRHLLTLVRLGQASQKTYALLAELERRERRDEKAALGWLSKLPSAPFDAAWICRSCGAASAVGWQAQCPDCGAFSSFVWQVPGESSLEASNLPLLTPLA